MPQILIDKGMNDGWVLPKLVERTGRGRYALTLCETLGRAWGREIVSYPFPQGEGKGVIVTLDGAPVPCQMAGGRLHVLVDGLAPDETRVYQAVIGGEPACGITPGITFGMTASNATFSNGLLSLNLPNGPQRAGEPVRGPIVAVKAGDGPWLGQGRIESPLAALGADLRITEAGPLFTTVEVAIAFEGGYHYIVELTLRPDEAICEVAERSTLPVRLMPAWRPYREIGCLGASHWSQAQDTIADPCLRPCPTSNFLFEVRAGFAADRLITHSTASWEIMDLPLASPKLKTYTALRPALPSIDGSWFGVYDSSRDELLGVAAVDIAHWGVPDDTIHPAHRTVGASSEVLLVDSAASSHFRFPIENVSRRWLLTIVSRAEALGEREPLPATPIRRDPDHTMPLWTLHTRRGDLRLDKVKEWITDWPDAGEAHPRVLCTQADFPAIREKVRTVPELAQCFAETRDIRAADRFMLEGERSGLAVVEEATHGRELIEGILDAGFTGKAYCIGLARPMRRYALACDVLWDCFTPEEKREARRVCALAAYLMSDGDWWQFVFRPGETTYLPNFNSDVFTCTGIIGLFLNDHPCAERWVDFCVRRMDIELPMYLRRDGGGEENVGSYYWSTWSMLYMPAFWALRHCGVKDYSTDPNVLAGGRFMLKVYGPADPRDGDQRQPPPIGHHPHVHKKFPMLAWLAAFIKDADPALSSNLMWAWREAGSPVQNFYDHSGPTAGVFTRHFVFHDPSIPAIAPEVGSYDLPHVGAVLRSQGIDPQGSYLFLKAGPVHSHHDEDEGSFHFFGRGVPLALDGLQIQNGATAAQHNAVTFGCYGQPSGRVEQFATTPTADYVRAVIAPRAFSCDAMFIDGTHRSGWVRELLLVKAPAPGGVEYLVVKDSALGPDAPQWNLDVLSTAPQLVAPDHVWYPGHPEFGMGMDVIFCEPAAPEVAFEAGIVNPALLTPEGRATLTPKELAYTVTEHWLLHVPAGPGSTFVAVLFPRRADEPAPQVEYLAREETLAITHAEGRDLVFLRPNATLPARIDGVFFQGRAGLARSTGNGWAVTPLDAKVMAEQDTMRKPWRIL
jgi:hypothetical protein